MTNHGPGADLPKLKRCPFCGEDPWLDTDAAKERIDRGLQAAFTISCKACTASVFGNSLKNATDWWNERVEDEAKPAAGVGSVQDKGGDR